ncbi:pre-mRNA-splicing factor Slu7 [Anopheles maculipalpis]|uniref:pre-mRNA-splicing factor Slu7 n=1 Tax=Anopheles maculipalpis TaxID=1496333 RepID=UPI0021595408|nr:pre-mRNA-splicing factor Slu7 [Anopheles maculipalpis]
MVSSGSRLPLSMLLQTKEAADEEPRKASREDWRKAKELEEARKAGNAPAAVDEEGRDINPHIPQYISSAPWYYNTAGPTLKHQRPQDDNSTRSGIDEWYKRGVDTSKPLVTKFRKGACENCGAMTHKRVDCMERPRKVGAKFSAKQIAHDEFIQPNIVSDYDGKRDRWAGYDPANHREIVEEYLKIEQAKRELRAQKLKENPDLAEEQDEEADEDRYVDEVDMPGTKVDSKQRITVRNLRIREDTAKYLRNLDPNSAYYDPKTRSMRDNPTPQLNPEETEFAGENFVRYSGDIQKHAQAQLFAWEAYGKGVDVHVLAEPTKLELLQKEYDKKKSQFKDEVKNKVLEQYGGEEHLAVPPKALLLAQTENYVEYSRYGKVIKGQDKPIIRSRYEEDVYINNHTTVWGSHWSNGCWGYKCCESMIKNSYCVGENGKAATIKPAMENEIAESGTASLGESEASKKCSENPTKTSTPTEEVQETVQAQRQQTRESSESKGPEQNKNSSGDSNSDSDSEEPDRSKESRKSKKKRKKEKKRQQRREEKKLRKKSEGKVEKDKLQLALEAEEANERRAAELLRQDERKRPYNSMYDVKAPTEEEIEAYMLKRRREEDPMLAFMSK